MSATPVQYRDGFDSCADLAPEQPAVDYDDTPLVIGPVLNDDPWQHAATHTPAALAWSPQ